MNVKGGQRTAKEVEGEKIIKLERTDEWVTPKGEKKSVTRTIYSKVYKMKMKVNVQPCSTAGRMGSASVGAAPGMESAKRSVMEEESPRKRQVHERVRTCLTPGRVEVKVKAEGKQQEGMKEPTEKEKEMVEVPGDSA